MINVTFLIAVFAYIVFNFAFALLWNLRLFKQQYAALVGAISRDKPLIPLGFLAIVVQAVTLSILFSLFFEGTHPVSEGLRLGLLVGSYSLVYGAFVVPAKFRIASIRTYALLELAYGVLHFGIAGVLLAFIFA